MCHPRSYSLTKKASQASQEEKAKSSANGNSSHHNKKIPEFFVAHEKYNSDNPCAKVLTKAVGYFIAKDLMPTSVVQWDGFHKLLEMRDPHYQLSSRKTLSDKVIPALHNVKDTKCQICCPYQWLLDKQC